MIFTATGIYTNYMLFHEIYQQHEIRISKMYLDFCKRVYSDVIIKHWTQISRHSFDIPEMVRLYAEINPRIAAPLVTMIINAALEMTPIDQDWLDSNKEAIPGCSENYASINEFRGLLDPRVYTGIFAHLAIDIISATSIYFYHSYISSMIQAYTHIKTPVSGVTNIDSNDSKFDNSCHNSAMRESKGFLKLAADILECFTMTDNNHQVALLELDGFYFLNQTPVDGCNQTSLLGDNNQLIASN